jgi:hypothetical protein
MQSIADKKTTEIDLDKFMIDFGPVNGYEIYRSNLFKFDSREQGRILGYNSRTGHPSLLKEKNGKYKASRFRKMCEELKIKPEDIRSGYESKVLMWSSHCWIKVDESLERTVWDAICDNHDN